MDVSTTVMARWLDALTNATAIGGAEDDVYSIIQLDDIIVCMGTGAHAQLDAESVNCDFPLSEPGRPVVQTLDDLTFPGVSASLSTSWLEALMSVAHGASGFMKVAFQADPPVDPDAWLRCQAVFANFEQGRVIDVVAVSCWWTRDVDDLHDQWLANAEGCIVATSRNGHDPSVPALWLYRGGPAPSLLPDVHSIWPAIRNRTLRILTNQLLP